MACTVERKCSITLQYNRLELVTRQIQNAKLKMAEGGDSELKYDEVSGKIKDIFCQPCLQMDKQSTAEKFCLTCDEFQCTDCLKGHYRYAYMRGHKLVNVNEAERKQVSFDMKGLDRCNQHQKAIEYFCEDENQLCCSTCAIVDHRGCKSVKDIQTIVGKLGSKNPSLKVKLQEVKQKAEIIINDVVFSKEKLNEDVKEIPIKIRQMRDEVNKMFDDLEESVVKNAETFQTETLEKLTKKQSQNEKYLADIQSYQETVDDVYQNGTAVQQFIVEEKLKEEINVLHTKVDAEFQNLETVTVSFDFDEVLTLPPQPITDYVPGQLSLRSHLSEAVRAMIPDVTTMKLTPVISVDVKRSEDDNKEPLYTGIDFLPDGRLVAVDNKNMKCLVYNEKFEKVGSYQLSYPPLSVVVVSEEEVAITSANFDILRVNKYNQITLDRSYNVTTEYNSICLKDNGQFVVGTIDHVTPVRILSSTGEEKDFNINFPNKKYHVDTSACTYIRNSDKIVLTDRYEHAVYIYDVKTNTRVVVKDDHIKGPRGAAVGPYDTILVCSQNTNSIIQISQTGRVLSSYKIDMDFPRTICVSCDKSFLVVINPCIGDRKMQKLKITY